MDKFTIPKFNRRAFLALTGTFNIKANPVPNFAGYLTDNSTMIPCKAITAKGLGYCDKDTEEQVRVELGLKEV